MNAMVLAAVERAVLQHYGSNGVVVDMGDPVRRRWSWHFDIALTGAHRADLLLKIPRWAEAPTLEDAIAAGPQPSTVTEAETLQALSAVVGSSSDPGIAHVAVIAYLDAVNGILMDRFDGEPLRRRLRIGRRGRDLEAVFARLARLVDLFHSLEPADREGFDPAAAGTRLDDLLAGAQGVPRPLRESAEHLSEAAATLAGTDEPVGLCHGDLNIDNVLVNRAGQVALLDPNPTSGSLLRDLALLTADVDLDRMQLTSAGVARPAALRRRWESALWGGSRLGSERIGPYRLAEAIVERWVVLESELVGPRRLALVPGRRVLRRTLNRRVEALL